MSNRFPASAHPLGRTRAEGPPAIRERRVAGDTESERSSNNRAVNGQHLAVLNVVKQLLPALFSKSPADMRLWVVEDAVVERCEDGVERVHHDCVLEVGAVGVDDVELGLLRLATRSIVSQLSANPRHPNGMPESIAQGHVRKRLGDSFPDESDAADDALLVLLGRSITRPFKLVVPGFDDLSMSGAFLSAPEYASPAREKVFKGRIGGGSFLKKKRELQLLVDAPPGARKKYETVLIEYNPPQHKLIVHPLLLEPEQVVYLKVKSSRVRRANGTTSNPYELVEVLTARQAEEVPRDIEEYLVPAGRFVPSTSDSQSPETVNREIEDFMPA